MKGRLRNVLACASLLLLSCGDSGGSSDEVDCQPGTEFCMCLGGTTCGGDLVCDAGYCVDPGSGESDATESSGNTDSTEETGSTDTTEVGDEDTTGDDDTGSCQPDELFCGGACIDPQIDNDHCGACNNACIINAGEGGECTAGQCAPTLSACVSAVRAKSCDEVCGAEGMQCVEEGCDDASVIWYIDSADCEDDVIASGWQNNECGMPINNPLHDYYRCCCQQPPA